jgi:predicted enzyme related to lactoylglutathione lyase
MNLVSTRIITDNVSALADFYAKLTAGTVVRPHELFAEVHIASGTLAIGATATVALFGPGSARPADNHSVIIEFLVDDVDAEHEKVQNLGAEIVTPPTTMPWGNRSLLFRDPDGNLVNFFTPVTPDAIEKFARYER